MEINNKVQQIVVGHTLDAVIAAHNLAMNENNEVTLYCTGELGYPLDIYNDYISYEDAKRLGAITKGIGYTECINPSYIYLPYDKVKFKNSTNGVIQFPFTKNSFEDENEWKELCQAYDCDDIKEILQKTANSPTRLITMFKNNLPKWFVDSVIRNIVPIRWKFTPISMMTLNGFLYEYNFDTLPYDGIYKWYKPNLSFKEICMLILKEDHINLKPADKETCFNLITNREIENVTFMDNRIDYYMDYRCGMFDRCLMTAEVTNEVPDFMTDIHFGYVRTPTMDYWGVNVDNNVVKKFYCERIKSIKDVPQSLCPMTKNNMRMYYEYSNILPRYGKNKTLNFSQKIHTLIK